MSPPPPLAYDRFTRVALLGIVRTALTQIAQYGLPGKHHLFISFNTQHADCVIPKHLRERYREEMTIVLQHQFSGLRVAEKSFRVELKFDGRPYKLTIAFDALTGFFDPTASFGLRFDPIKAHTSAVMPSKSKSHEAEAQAQSRHSGNVIDLSAFSEKKG